MAEGINNLGGRDGMTNGVTGRCGFRSFAKTFLRNDGFSPKLSSRPTSICVAFR